MKKIFGLFLLGFALVNCSDSDSDDIDPNEQVAIRLSSDVAITRYLQNTQIEAGQDLSFFVTPAGETSTLYNNVIITASDNNTFNYSQQLYYPLGAGNNVDFYAMNPYIPGVSLTESITFSVKEDQSEVRDYLDSDLLYASTKNVVRTNEPVLLSFVHKLSKVSFVVRKSGLISLEDLNNIEVQNVMTDINILLATGALTNVASTETSNITVSNVRGDDSDYISDMAAIIVPQRFDPAGGKPFLMVTIGENNFYYTPESEIVFESGKSYNFNITVYNTGITVSSTILEWDEQPDIDGDGTPGN